MNNLDTILSRIREEGEEKAKEIKTKAKEAAGVIRDEARREAEAEAEATLAEANREHDRILERARSGAAMNRRSILLAGRVEAVESVYRRATEALGELSEADYADLLAGLLAGAAKERLDAVSSMLELYGETESAESPIFEAIFNEKDKKQYGKAAVAEAKARLAGKDPMYAKVKIALSADTSPISGGVILRYGDIETNCSFESLIDAARNQMDAEVVKVLFPG